MPPSLLAVQIKREVMVLQNLSGGPNIVELLDVVRHPESKTPSLVFEYIQNTDFRLLYPTLTDRDVRYYLLQLLQVRVRDVAPASRNGLQNEYTRSCYACWC